MNAIVAVQRALQREDADPRLTCAVAALFDDHGHDSPAAQLAAYGFALLRAATAFDPGFRFEDGFDRLLALLPDRSVERLAECAVAEDSERFFARAA
jgi:hypothetical protein